MDSRISYINSTHDKRQLIFNGARFCMKQKNLHSILWRCTRAKCSASITISNNQTILRIDEVHNHFIESNDVKLLQLRHKLKNEAQTTSTPVDRIVETAYCAMITEEKKNDSIVKLPTIKTLKNTVSKQRRKIRPSLPKFIENIPSPLPQIYTLTKQKDDFLLFDGDLGGTRGFIFASHDDIRYLANRKFWYGDGTFYTAPSIFYQIYSIHAFDEGLSTPCVYALLADKAEATYCDFFSVLMNKMIELCNTIRLESITIDFELGVKNVFDKHYSHVQVKGCLFHYGQALFRNFVDLHLKAAYQQDETLRIWFRSFAAIALLPPNDMNEAIDYLQQNKPSPYEEPIHLFLRYHNKTYGVNGNFPPTMYNHYRNITPRTINYLEGRHNRWKKRSSKAHSDIYTCIDMFKGEQFLTADARQRHQAGAAPPKRRRTTRVAEESLFRLWDKLEKEQIDRQTFLKNAGLRYFQYIEIE